MERENYIFLNERKSSTKNIFDFIDEKLAFGVGECSYYFTDIGAYVVDGPWYCYTFEEYVDSFDTSSEYGYYGFDDCPDDIKEAIKYQWGTLKYQFMDQFNLTDEDIERLDELHKQYLAIVGYSKAKTDEEKSVFEKIIRETYASTGINCLELLQQKQDWTKIIDLQGLQLAVAVGGCVNEPIKDKAYAKYLEEMHEIYNSYIDKIYEICNVKTDKTGRKA